MKKTIYFLYVLFLITSCKSAIENFFSYDDYKVSQTSPMIPYLPVDDVVNKSFTQAFDANKKIKEASNGKANAQRVQKFILDKAEVVLTSPTNGNWEFLDEITFYAKSDNQSMKKIAFSTNIPTQGNIIELETTKVVLDNMIRDTGFSITIELKTNKEITNLQFVNNFFFDFKADL